MKAHVIASGPPESKPTVEILRQRLSADQSKLLDEIWNHFRVEGEWPILRELYSKHGKQAVRKALLALTGNVGWEESRSPWSWYRLSLLGILLTKDGPALQNLLAQFFGFQRDLFRQRPKDISVSSDEIAKALSLSDEETAMLGQMREIGSFGGGGSFVGGEWVANSMEEAADFPDDSDLAAYVGQYVCKFYRPDAPVFQDQRMANYLGTPLPESMNEFPQKQDGRGSPPIAKSRTHLINS